MKTAKELSKKLARQWESGVLREARLLDEEGAWPVSLVIGKPKAVMMRDETATVRDHFQGWREVKVGEVVWEKSKYRAMDEEVAYPARWVIRDAEEWVAACGERAVSADYEKLSNLFEVSEEIFHALLIRRRSLWRGRSFEEVEQGVRMAAKLAPGCADGVPLRALPLVGNDTKFFERNEGLLLALLDVRFDGEASGQGLEGFLGAASERGHWLLLVDLDGGLLPFRQLRVRAGELEKAGLPGSCLLVVENEACQYQLPSLAGTIAVLGTGFDLGWMRAEWLREKKVGYWGDLDTWGLELLGRARGNVASLMALMMTEDVFDAHEAKAVCEKTPAGERAHSCLKKEEGELYERLRNAERGRLEQEFLPEKMVVGALEAWRNSGESGPVGL